MCSMCFVILTLVDGKTIHRMLISSMSISMRQQQMAVNRRQVGERKGNAHAGCAFLWKGLVLLAPLAL